MSIEQLNKILLSKWKCGETLLNLFQDVREIYGQVSGGEIFYCFAKANKKNQKFMEEFNRTAFL
jgi:hypothetical protein